MYTIMYWKAKQYQNINLKVVGPVKLKCVL